MPGAWVRPAAGWLFAIAGLAIAVAVRGAAPGVFNIRDHGAIGDGRTLDTAAINATIQACSAAGGGQVLFPPGRFLSGTVVLKSHVTLWFEAAATLVGTTNLSEYRQPIPPATMPEAKWGKWHRGLLVGEGIEDVTIGGPGVIDGNQVFDPTGEERMRGPHTLVFVDARRFTIQDLTFLDSANYAILFLVSDQVEVRNVRFLGGWDGVHFRGEPGRDCRDVRITGCEFYTGDDAIAGRYWDNTLISGCIINSSCNGIRLIGPATRLMVNDCLFYGPGVRPHRTSNRQNMLSGIILQPGAWDSTRGHLDDVLISDVSMRNVASPVTIWTKPGNTCGRITISDLSATGVYRSAISVESYAETPITNVVFRDIDVEFNGGGTAEQAAASVRGPGVDARPLPAWGVYARNVERLSFQDVRFTSATKDLRPVVIGSRVSRLELDDVRFPRVAEAPEFLRLEGDGELSFGAMAREIGVPRCVGVRFESADDDSTVRAGKPFVAIVTFAAGAAELQRIDLRWSDVRRSHWLPGRATGDREARLPAGPAPAPGVHTVRANDFETTLVVAP